MPEKRLQGDVAGVATSVIAFLVAGLLFMASIVAVLVTTRDSATRETSADPLEAAQLTVQASNLANLLLDSPGFVVSGAEFGQNLGIVGYDGKIDDADAVTRLGLLDPDSIQPFMMDFAKFQNLRQAPFSPGVAEDCDGDGAIEPAEGDCYVNYEEAREQLGLTDQGLNFHIRSYPNLRSYDELLSLGVRDQNLKIAYIADATAAVTTTVPYGYLLELRNPAGVASGACIIHTSAPSGYVAAGTNLYCSPTATANPFSCTATTKGYRIATDVVNGGATTTRFKGVFSFGSTGIESMTQYSHVVPVGGTTQLFVDLAATSGRSCASLPVTLKLYDPDKQILEITRTLTQPSPAPTTATKGFALKVTGALWEESDNVDFTYAGVGLTTSDKVILVICPDETECDGVQGGTVDDEYLIMQNVPNSDSLRKFEVPKAELDVDADGVSHYIARLYFNPDGTSDIDAGDFVSAVRFMLLADAKPNAELPAYKATVPVPDPTAGNYDASSAVSVEVSYINDLMGRFCPFWYDSTTSSPITGQVYGTRCTGRTGWPHVGDVYSTDGTQLKRNIDDRLYDDDSDCDNDGDITDDPAVGRECWTDILVVGSEVDHEKMTNGQVKDAIKDWVYAGGTLVVFGSADQKTEWLQSIFHTALEGGEHGNGVSVPDEGHPVLNVPNDLAWDAYRHLYSWRLKETGSFNAEEAFTRVVNEDGGTPTNPPNTVLAVGDPGDFGRGNVIITGWTPWDLEVDGTTSTGLRDEGRMFVHNLLMLGYTDLYLDYGPELPEQANVVPAVRTVQICHPEFDDETTPLCDDPIPMAMQVYVFR